MIYTIGYGGMKNVDQLIKIMDDKDITRLIDVRTVPRAWCNAFSKPALQDKLGERYEWLGFKLGGLYEIKEDAIAELSRRHQGERLLLMCAEKDPASCHRHQQIARRLLKYGVIAVHLIGKQEYPADQMPLMDVASK
ncbi:MAG: DUF488 domain-containing protein [Nitrospirae bacterium]|nr:DUF488 domain-containing protein [Nitrospirota bacterium]